MPIFNVEVTARMEMAVQADSHEEAISIAQEAFYDYLSEDEYPELNLETLDVLEEISELDQAPYGWNLNWPIHGRDDEKTLRDLLPAEEE
jgi:hypothetical protein